MKQVVSVIAVLAIATAAQAAVVGSYTSSPTTDLPGYTTYAISLTSDYDDLSGFEVSLTADAANQVYSGLTIFEDNNAFFESFGALEEQDTQFNFLSTEVSLSYASEGTGPGVVLAGTFTLGGPIWPPAPYGFNLITLCMPTGNTAVLSGMVALGLTEEAFADLVIPEPATLALLAAGGLAMLRRRSRQALRRRR